MRLTLSMLRKMLPKWTWRGERYGFGWNYVGTRDGQSVSVEARSEAEDAPTSWWVYDNERRGERFEFWAFTRAL